MILADKWWSNSRFKSNKNTCWIVNVDYNTKIRFIPKIIMQFTKKINYILSYSVFSMTRQHGMPVYTEWAWSRYLTRWWHWSYYTGHQGAWAWYTHCDLGSRHWRNIKLERLTLQFLYWTIFMGLIGTWTIKDDTATLRQKLTFRPPLPN